MDQIHRRHNVSLLIYHLVCPVKFRRNVFTTIVEETLRKTCLELGLRYEIRFIEIGVDGDHCHFLVQTILRAHLCKAGRSLSETVKIIKSLTAREIFKAQPEVKTFLWKSNFWTMGYYVNTVGQYGNLKMLTNYVKNQGIKDYKQLHSTQPTLFDYLQ